MGQFPLLSAAARTSLGQFTSREFSIQGDCYTAFSPVKYSACSEQL